MSNYTKTIDWLNKQYQAYPLNIQANRTTLMNHLWMLLKVSLGCDYKVDDNNEQFINQLNMVVQKLFTGWSHPCVSLFKIAINVQLNANEDYTDDTYDGDFGDQLRQSQIEMGIDATSAYFISQIKRLFAKEPLQYDRNCGDYKLRQIAQIINHYFANEKPELAAKYGLLRSDGSGIYYSYATNLIIYWQSRNNEPITGIMKLPANFEYDQQLYNITDPIQYAFYLQGLTSLVGWTGSDNYHDDIANYQRLLGDKVDVNHLTNREIEILFNVPNINNTYNTLTFVRNIKSNLRSYFNKLPELDFSYTDAFDLGENAIVTPDGLIIGVKLQILQNRNAFKMFGLDYDHPENKVKINITDNFTSGTAPLINGSFETRLQGSDDDNMTLTTSMMPLNAISQALNLNSGAGSVSTTIDPVTQKITITYKLKMDSIKDPKTGIVHKLSMPTTIKIDLYITLNNLFSFLGKHKIEAIDYASYLALINAMTLNDKLADEIGTTFHISGISLKFVKSFATSFEYMIAIIMLYTLTYATAEGLAIGTTKGAKKIIKGVDFLRNITFSQIHDHISDIYSFIGSFSNMFNPTKLA